MKYLPLITVLFCLLSVPATASDEERDLVVPIENGFVLISQRSEDYRILSTFIINQSKQIELVDEYHYKPASPPIKATSQQESFTKRISPSH